MSFVAVSAFRPVQKPHPLAALARVPDQLRAFEPPTAERVFANAMQVAVGRYAISRTTRISDETTNDWIRMATQWPGYEHMSATMVVAVLVLMRYAETPTEEDVAAYGQVALEPLLKPDDAELYEHQLADLWRYTQRIQELRG